MLKRFLSLVETLDIQKCKKWATLKHNHICSLSFYLFSKFSVFESYNKSFPSASFKKMFFHLVGETGQPLNKGSRPRYGHGLIWKAGSSNWVKSGNQDLGRLNAEDVLWAQESGEESSDIEIAK